MLVYIAIVLTLTSFGDKTVFDDSDNQIEIGVFTFLFPKGFKLIKEQGTDSYAAKISNGKIIFRFDYGYYSNSLDRSIKEYLSQDVWKWNGLGQNDLLPSGTDLLKVAKGVTLIDSQTNDSLNYHNLYLYKGDTIEYELAIPEEIRNTRIEMDTIDDIAYKFVRKSDYVGLYAKDLKSFNKSINSYMALSIDASDLSREETEIAYEILRSCKSRK